MEPERIIELIGERYPELHQVRSNKDLFRYVQGLKMRYMQSSPVLGAVGYDRRLRSVNHALGLHMTKQHVHGSRVHKRREIKIASLFKDAPLAFLRMVVVHELAHMKHSDHSQAFLKLCCYMEPDYHQLELDFRIWLGATDLQASTKSP